jgi:hypothetical protein
VTEPLKDVRHWPGGRWAALAGSCSGIAVFVLTIGPESLYGALWRAAAAAVAVGGALALLHKLGRGDELEEIGAPGGWTFRFTQAAARPIRLLTRRVDAELRALEERVVTLERDVTDLKKSAHSPDTEE